MLDFLMNENENETSLYKNFIAIILSLILIAVIIAIYAAYGSESNARNLLERQGYDLTDIEFTRVSEWYSAPIYQLSEPLLLSSGEMCDLWRLESISRQMPIYTFITPYPVDYYKVE